LKRITRVCGPFVVEATIPTAHGLDEEPDTPRIQSETHADFTARMLEVLRKSPVLRKRPGKDHAVFPALGAEIALGTTRCAERWWPANRSARRRLGG
jgi:hypothetical protein